MQITIIKKDNGSFSLVKENLEEIENYSFESTIDFHKLMSALIELELTEKVVLASDFVVDDLGEQEKKLVSLITNIIEMYNERVDSLNITKTENK